MSLKKYARADVIHVGPNATVMAATGLMESHNTGSVLVVQDGKVAGILTDRDVVLRVINQGRDPTTTTVEQVMTKDPITIREDVGLYEALELVKNKSARRFPVVDANGQLTGLVALDDVIYLLGKEMANVASIVGREGAAY
jgi:CBS domain-containing protein